MTDAKIVMEDATYVVVVSPPVEDVAHESHYAVLNKEYNVVEFRTPVYANAVHYMQDAEEFVADQQNRDFTSQVSDDKTLN